MSFTQVAAGGVRTIGVAIRGDETSLLRSLARSSAEIQSWERTTSNTASRWSTAWKAATAIAVAGILAMVTGLTAAGVAAAGFDQRMRNVNSLLHESAAGLSSMSGEVLKLATELPTGANDLAEGLYDIASSGFDGAEGLTVLDASARAASAGLATTSDSVTAITAVLNAYGLSASSASDVSDILFQTVNLGVLQFSDLTGVIGDVVGMASAARVPIDDVGSAIATMTLTGLSAAESGTSLNRVIQALIDPSEALAGVYQTLGYESGLTALQTEGLYGVMEDLRKATGGSAEEYLKLFPEVRAARAAFALATDEGQTYARVQAEIGDETARLGATQSTLDEQMKSTAAQWTVLTNTLQAGVIGLGQKVLPAVNDVLGAVQDLAEDAVPALEHGLSVVQPMLDTLYQAGVNVAEILGAIYDATSPVAEALAKMVGGATLAGLSVLGESLEAITGFLTEHPALVVTVAALWASRFLPSITSVVGGLQQLGKSMQYNVIWRLAEARQAWDANSIALQNQARFTGGAHVATSRLGTALRTTAGVARSAGSAFLASGLATAALSAGLMAIVYAATDGANNVRESISNITSGVDTLNDASVEEGIERLKELQTALGDVRLNVNDGHVNSPWEAYDTNKQIEETNNALVELQTKSANTTLNLIKLRDATGLSVDELRRLQEAQGVDLTAFTDEADAKAGRDQLVAYIQDIEKQTGISASAMSDDWQMSIEDQQALADAIQATADKVKSAFAGATDVLGTWQPDIGVQEEKDALERLADARERLNDVEKDAKSETTELKNARKSVADAEAALAEAQEKKAEGTLEAFYRNAIEMSSTFSTNLDTAVRMGLDPSLVAKLLQEGPEQAGPIVQQMVNDNSGALIQMVNDAEAQLAEIQARVVEQSRLTSLATNSATDEMAKDLSSALDISSMAWDGSTPEDIAAKLGLDVDEIRRIAEEFGITLAQGIQAGFDSAKPVVRVDGSVWTGSGNQVGMANGGIYPGYTPGRDIGYIGISGGEAVMRPEFTRGVGPDWVHRMNALARSGGVSAVRAAMGAYLGGFAGGGIPGYSQPNVITVPYAVTNERHDPMTFTGPNYFGSAEGVRPWANRRRAGLALAGRRG